MQRDLHGLTHQLKTISPDVMPKIIVYVLTKNMACKVYHFLKGSSANKQSVGVYHADLTASFKSSVYQEFSRPTSHIRCLVATVAFGMVCVCCSRHFEMSCISIGT